MEWYHVVVHKNTGKCTFDYAGVEKQIEKCPILSFPFLSYFIHSSETRGNVITHSWPHPSLNSTLYEGVGLTMGNDTSPCFFTFFERWSMTGHHLYLSEKGFAFLCSLKRDVSTLRNEVLVSTALRLTILTIPREMRTRGKLQLCCVLYCLSTLQPTRTLECFCHFY